MSRLRDDTRVRRIRDRRTSSGYGTLSRLVIVAALVFALVVVVFTMRGASKIASVLTLEEPSVESDEPAAEGARTRAPQSLTAEPAHDDSDLPSDPSSADDPGSTGDHDTQILEIGIAD